MSIFGKKERDPASDPAPSMVPAERPAAVAKGDIGATAPGRREPATATTIGPTIRIKGEMAGDEDVTIEGRLEGIVNLNRSLTVGKTGVVEADIRALNVVVYGRVVGNVIAEQRVEIHPSGRLEGNIKCPKISIHEGAHFKGNVDMSGGAGGASLGLTDGGAPKKAIPERKP